MPNIFTPTTFANTYKDDYKDSDGYHRILFNSGVPLQARELTQLQTILQQQVTRMGRNLFLDGAAVNPKGGAPSIIPVNYVTVKSTNWPADLTTLPGTIFQGPVISGQTAGYLFKVTHYADYVDSNNKRTLFGTYIDANQNALTISSQTGIIEYSEGDVLTDTASVLSDLTVDSARVASHPAHAGVGTRFATSETDFFINGYFVHSPAQSIILSRYSYNNVNADIGFQVLQDVITVTDTDALYDNQGAVPNRSAPGADRFRIRLKLVDKKTLTDKTNFIPFATVRNGQIVQVKEGTDNYNQIEKRLATRSFDTNGNFIVNPFDIRFEDEGESDKLQLYISNSVNGQTPTAFLDGYRLQQKVPRVIEVSKPISTTQDSSVIATSTYGNYVVVDSASTIDWSGIDSAFNGTTAIINDAHNLYDSTGTNAIGTCRVRAVEKIVATPSTYRFFLYNIEMNSGKNFRNVREIGTSDSATFIPTLEDSNLYISNPTNNNAFFSIPGGRVASHGTVSYTVQRQRYGAASSNQIVITKNSGETFEDENKWVVINATTNAFQSITESNISVVGDNATISGLFGATDQYLIYYYVGITGTAREKSYDSAWFTGVYDSDTQIINFTHANAYDGIKLINAYDSDSTGSSILNFVEFDGGQRDNFYDKIKLRVKNPSIFTHNQNAVINVTNFTHGTGDFFSVSSYTTAANRSKGFLYRNIPTYLQRSGEKIRLTDVLDFRPKLDGNASQHNLFPRNNNEITFSNVTYYNSRIDHIVLGYDPSNFQGRVFIRRGVESRDPVPPNLQRNQLHLFTVRYGGNTISPNDMSISRRKYKRYRMEDISNLEERVSRLEKTTSLSFLETNTATTVLLDAAGNVRSKSGFFVENFNRGISLSAGDKSVRLPIGEREQTFSIDPVKNRLYPKLMTNQLRLIHDSANTYSGATPSISSKSNIKRVGDIIYLDFVESLDSDLTQTVIAEEVENIGYMNVNPYNVFSGEGLITMSPNTDIWVETRRIADNIVNGGIQVNRVLSPALNGNEGWWEFGWQGNELPDNIDPNSLVEGQTVASITDLSIETSTTSDTVTTGSVATTTTTTTTDTTTTTVVDRITSVEVVEQVIGDRIVQTFLLPWMRNRLIHIKAEGLRANTAYWPYFDNVNVLQWCNQVSIGSESIYSQTSTAEDDVRPFLTQHPDGGETSAMVSDNQGQLSLTFWLPNTAAVPDDGFSSLQEYENWYETQVVQSQGATIRNPAVLDTIGWKFRAGSKEFKLLDVSDGVEHEALSLARAYYVATGTLNVNQADLLSTRIVTVERSASVDTDTTSENTVTTVDVGGGWTPVGEPEADPVDPGVTEEQLQTGIGTDGGTASVANTDADAPTSIAPWWGQSKDPLAQTFMLNARAGTPGVFITSIDVYLHSWPTTATGIPLQLQIRGVRDGTPLRGEISPQHRVYKYPAAIQSATSGMNKGNLASVLAHPVNFAFPEPIYIETGKEYAIVLLAETDEYEAYISTTYELELGSTANRISKQPSLGSLFMSQNGSTWSPAQDKDLAYRIHTAKFKTSGHINFYNAALPKFNHASSRTLELRNGSNSLRVNHQGHGLFDGDKIKLLGLDSATSYAGVTGAQIMSGSLTVASADVNGYTSTALGATATGDLTFGADSVSTNRNMFMDKASINILEVTPPATKINYAARFVSGMSHSQYGEVTDPRFNIDNSMTGFRPNKTIYFSSPKMIANPDEQLASISANEPSVIVTADLISNQTSSFAYNSANFAAGYRSDISPMIDLQRCGIVGINYAIDNQPDDGVETTTANVPYDWTAETSAIGGTSMSKHLTKPIDLASDATGLKVYIDAHKPPSASFDLYYRTVVSGGEANDIYTVAWTKATAENTPGSNPLVLNKITPLNFSEYEYLIGGTEGTLPAFGQFQLKIVMRTTNTCHLPVFDNIRVIALV